MINFRSNLVNGLNNDYNKDIKKSEITINNKNNPTKDHTLRSRSLLYGFLGIAFAKCLDLKDVYLSDNGIISLNLKSTAQNIDTLNTRSTNPKLIYLVNQLSKLLWNEKAPQIENLLLWKTKGEIIEELKTLKKSKLLAFTSSCVSTINLSISEPYCGICSQCIDRRFAVDWANISDNDDPRSHYKVNIFQDDLVGINDKGIAKTHAENFYRKARFIYQASDYEFLNFNNELYDYIPDNEDEEDFLRKAFDLHKRFSNQVLDVIGQFGTEYLKRDFPENSLISMAFRESSSKIDLNEYSLPKKKDLIINKRMHQVLYKGIEINLTPFEFKFLLRLASEPEACITYEELQTGEDSGKDSYSTPAHTHRTNINKKFKDTCKKWHIGLHNKFSITETISGKGYRLNSDLRESFEII